MVKNYFFRTIITGGLLMATLISKAQHDPYFTHFRWNRQAYNPAAAGYKEDYICINGLSHYQYRQYNDETFVTGTELVPNGEVIKNVAPETYNLNLNTLFKIGKSRNKIGVGMTFMDDQIGYMKTTTVKGALNFRKPIQGDFGFLAFGVEVGSTSFGYDNPKFRALDPNDPKVPTGGGSQSKLDLGVGVYYQQKKFLNVLSNFYVGASYNHLNAAKYNFTVQTATGQGAVDMDFVRYLYLTAGADWQLANPNWILEPAALIKYNPKLQLDLSMTALFSNSIRMGMGYRTAADAISLLVGYQRGQLQVGYSYDITITRIRQVSDGTHEVFVKYCF
ncbi:MAG: PorP/SprF family type IX secretion system membrane protein, partial [Bacteroidia bacterium]